MKRLLLPLALLAALLLGLFASHGVAPVHAQAPQREQQIAPEAVSPRKELDSLRQQVEQIEAGLSRKDLTDTELQARRAQIEPIVARLGDLLQELTPKFDAVKSRLDQLGQKPADSAAPESPGVAAERLEQQKLFSELDETVKRARLLNVQAEQISGSIVSRRRDIFARSLLQRTSSVLSPLLWYSVVTDLPEDLRAVSTLAQSWFGFAAQRIQAWQGFAIFAYIALVAFLSRYLDRFVRRIVMRETGGGVHSDLHRVASALWTSVVTAALPIIAVVGAFALLDQFHLLADRVRPVVEAVVNGFVSVSVAAGIAHGLLAPGKPEWRLLDLSDPVVRRLYKLALGATMMLAVAGVLESLIDVTQATLAVSVAVRSAGATLIALYMASHLNGISSFAAPDSEDAPIVTTGRDWYAPMRIAAWIVIAVILAAAVAGYAALAAFLVLQIAWLAGVGSMLYMLCLLADAAVERGLATESRFGRALMSSVGLRRESLDQIGVLLSGAAIVVLCALAAMLVLAPWGIQSNDFLGYVRAAFVGFKVGDVRISLLEVVIAIALFLAAMVATRAVQRWLDSRFLPRTSLDTGLRNAIRTSFGYVGFLLAASLGLSHLGLGFEKLAIVAGALSVGIGFGLQSIVNNFVSGLILLWERAIRVGDWIVVGDEQGHVRRINVRSTEIETFDRATVIVPNSNLVSGVVKNRVRSDRVGRVLIAVPVSYDSDPDKVRDILIGLAKANEFVLKIPAPSVGFASFGANALQFELVCFVDDVEAGARVKSDLHFEIFRAFREAGIGIAHQQGDMNIRGMDRLVEALAERAAPKHIARDAT